jgi:hypothetical protein
LAQATIKGIYHFIKSSASWHFGIFLLS